MSNKYLEKIAGIPTVHDGIDYIPKGEKIHMNPGDATRPKIPKGKNAAIVAGALAGTAALGYAANKLGAAGGRHDKLTEAKSRYKSIRQKALREDSTKEIVNGTALSAGIYGATGYVVGSDVAGSRARDKVKEKLRDPQVAKKVFRGGSAFNNRLRQGIKDVSHKGGKYGAAVGVVMGLAAAKGTVDGREETRRKLEAKQSGMQKVASNISKAGTLGKYLRDNVAVPIAPIFVADVGAHIAADKLKEKKPA